MSVSELGVVLKDEEPLSPPVPGRLCFYLLPFVLFPVLLLSASFLVVPTDWFVRHSGNPYLATIGYGLTLHHADCQVLIFGDSTAMTGISPAQIQARTGLSACNIAEYKGMTLIDGTHVVDMYLEHNQRPQFMVFMYVPEALNEESSWTNTPTFEAISFRIVHERDLHTLAILLRHPSETLGWAEVGMRLALLRFHSKPFPASIFHTRDALRGQKPNVGETETDCTPNSHHGLPDQRWTNQLRSKYGVGGTTVLVDATPTAPCDADLNLFRRVLPPIIDNNPYPTYPVDVFIKGERLHMDARGSAMVTDMIADQILAKIHAAQRAGQPSSRASSNPSPTGGL